MLRCILFMVDKRERARTLICRLRCNIQNFTLTMAEYVVSLWTVSQRHTLRSLKKSQTNT